MSFVPTQKPGLGQFLSLAAGIPALRAAAALFVTWWILLALFYKLPQIDLATSAAFFRDENCVEPVLATQVCGSFFYAGQPVFIGLRQVLYYLPHVCAVGLLALIIIQIWQNKTFASTFSRERLALMLAALMLGPVALVNLWLKAFAGRPRPYQTDLFGGDFTFMPAGAFGGQCISNCSFISGEAAGAGWLLCLVVLIPSHLRMILAPPIIAVALVTPALRVAFGGHYLSDVVLGWWSSLVIVALVMGVAQLLRLQKKRWDDVPL
ncbi:phosphatase PAP2 family protein [Rhizobium sp. RU36D]|uniref:phosphatase PAP2 family protein n=1 Tax=Rhizobium sp. RU36D TaxID=1907415 RepID=UPI0009D86675|nr:phosphatase PAP2 family protein [Rhizobium sp. RU36D]SMD06944.1 PAP2 superfamily protein [Rhizobium sp. RU36D]